MSEIKLNPMNKILIDPDRKIHETQNNPNGLLARFFRTILKENKIGPVIFEELLIRYLTYCRPGKVNVGNLKGPYHLKLSKDKLNWTGFIEAIKILGVWRMDITVRLHRCDGSSSVHTLPVRLLSDKQKEDCLNDFRKTHGDYR